TRMIAVSAMSLLRLGRRDEALELLKVIIEDSKKTHSGSPSFYAAMVYAQLGDADKAFQYLNQSHDRHEIEIYWCAVEPPFEPLRKDPRWKGVMSWVVFPNDNQD